MATVAWTTEPVTSMFGPRWMVVQVYPFKGRILSAIGPDGHSAALHFRTELDAVRMAEKLYELEIC